MDDKTLHLGIGIGLLFLFAVADWYILSHPAALRDAVSTEAVRKRPYSFSRVQLWWWTNIVIVSVLLVYMLTKGAMPALNATCLTLLGVGLGTNAAGRIIDNHDEGQQSAARHQDADSEGFFGDILSDNNGISIHRFQALAFNVIYGITFIVSVAEKAHAASAPYFPDYDSTTLGLLVASSSSYLVVKATENRPASAPGAGQPPAPATQAQAPAAQASATESPATPAA